MTVPVARLAKDALARVSDQVAVRAPEAGASADSLPVLPALQAVVPELRRGQVVAVDGAGALALAMVAGASGAGSWCAVVGLPEFGVEAAAGMGCDLGRMLLVDHPGERWADVVAALIEAVDVLLVRPPGHLPPGVVRRLMALARTSGCALVVTGPWEGAALRLRVASSLWTGVEQGHGHLRGRRVKVVAEGRGQAGRPRSAWLWLPAPDGSVAGADLVPVEDAEVA